MMLKVLQENFNELIERLVKRNVSIRGLTKFLENAKIRCLNCHEKMTLKFKVSGEHITIQCKCGTHVFYPPRKDRAGSFGHRFIKWNHKGDTGGCNEAGNESK